MAACTAAPNATASSGLIDLHGSLPLKNSWIIACTLGHRSRSRSKVYEGSGRGDTLQYLGDTSGSTDEYNLVHIALVNATVPHALLYRAHGVAEVVHAQLLKSRSGQRAIVVDALIEGINFNGGLRRRRQCALSSLALCAQAPDCTL
eukprot:4241496-Amphidinium_carterae.1